ncbi:unnamed protein product [Miscanthus lutarioriparius]|uniref:P-type ATPase A domain-containing protein n=1 Tax=Miscanthus lutarioriparius TaxID=422564 RepID=A0A811PHQ9_9POAL|nr:unnamed protein product [Miscanthus lutarioriparius]
MLVRILLVATAISFLLVLSSSASSGPAPTLTAFVEPLVIFLILIVNAAVKVWQEANAERALDVLREIQSHHAMLHIGDKVPADMRVASLLTSTLRLEQGSLTGETTSVNMTSHALSVEDVDIQAKECMVFVGTTVVNGAALRIVACTRMATEIGAIHTQIHQASQEDDDTPLKKKLNEFGEALTKIIGLIYALIWLINVKSFLTFDL